MKDIEATRNVCYIMCGVSGSGKTSYIDKHAERGDTRVSADNFFDIDGWYTFDKRFVGKAHQVCMRDFILSCQAGHMVIWVDNTNTRIAEIAPYHSVAEAYGYDVVIVHIATVEWEKACERGAHDVPGEVIQKQFERIGNMLQDAPPWWAIKTIGGGV